MHKFLFTFILITTSCYKVPITDGQYRCDRPGDSCPGDFVCIAGFCRDPSQVAELDLTLPPPGADLTKMPDPDLTAIVVDQAPSPDLTPITDMTAQPCTSGGTLVGTEGGKQAWACKGAFAAGKYVDLCGSAAGFRVCKDTDAAVLEEARRGTACGLAGGFYAADIPASFKPGEDDEVSCPPAGGAGRVLVGCGSEKRANGDITTNSIRNDCKKLKVMLACPGPMMSGWTCTNDLKDATHTPTDRGGVLCCKP